MAVEGPYKALEGLIRPKALEGSPFQASKDVRAVCLFSPSESCKATANELLASDGDELVVAGALL